MNTCRILVVDDQPHVVRVIRMALERKGFRVDTAADGQQALDKIQESTFDVLITDLDMPRLSGRGLCDAIASGVDNAPPLTFVVTGSTDPDLTEWAENLGQTFLLEKPLSLKHLTSLLAEHFDGATAA